jgi:hypothetical protein
MPRKRKDENSNESLQVVKRKNLKKAKDVDGIGSETYAQKLKKKKDQVNEVVICSTLTTE